MAGGGGRGWRRRPPFIRRARRPVRWIDGASSPTQDECTVAFSPMACGASGPRELMAGRIDLEFSDKNEATMVRVVGSFDLAGLSQCVSGNFSIPIMRMGLLLVEEQEAGGSPVLDLFDPDTLERYEWMWLWQSFPTNPWEDTCSAVLNIRWSEHVPVDVRVRRKAGRRDILAWYRQFAVAPTAVFNVAIDCAVQIRVLAMS